MSNSLAWYWEQRSNSVWSPVASPNNPDVKNGYLFVPGHGSGAEIRNVQPIEPRHANLTLRDLSIIYGDCETSW